MTAAVRVQDYLNKIGTCARLVDTSGDYGDARAHTALADIGLRSIRCGAPIGNLASPGGGLANVKTALQAGYHFTFTMRNASGISWRDSMLTLRQIAVAFPGQIDAIEGMNEVDHQTAPTTGSYPKLSGQSDAEYYAEYQDSLYLAVKDDLVLGGIDVYSYTDAGLRDAPSDVVNLHDYPRNGGMLGPRFVNININCENLAPGKRKVITEYGFHDLLTATPFPGTDQATAQLLLLNALHSPEWNGFDRSYIFQLLDGGPPTGSMETHFGLYDHDFNIKPAGQALKNYRTILQDTGATALTHTVTPSIPVSITAGVKSLSLARSDGATILIIWKDADIWNEATQTYIDIGTAPVTINWGHSWANSLQIFWPHASAVGQNKAKTSTLTTSLGCAPQIIIAK